MLFTKKLFLFLLLVPSSFTAFAQTTICNKANAVVASLDENHYASRALDEQFSVYLFDYFFEAIDEHRLIFSKEDYAQFLTYKPKLSEEILENNCSFIASVDSIYYQRLTEIKTTIENIDVSKISFNSKDSVVFADENIFYSEKDKLNSWTNFIKIQALYGHFSQNDSGSSDIVAQKTIEVAIQTQVCIIDAKLKATDFVHNSYLNAIANAFDPHSNYFSIDDKESFDSGLSKETKSVGVEIIKNDLEQIEIIGLMPGGPAWKSNLLNETDIILSVSNGTEKKSFVCITLQEALYFINSPDHATLIFEVSKKNGRNRSVTLTKEVLDVSENVIQSYVLEGEKKVGYIYLPSFYQEMDYGSYAIPNGCANDISKELFKLKREGIEALILDVRDNGGGSMLEAIRLSGVFIDYGAIAIMDKKGEEAMTLKDMARGVAFSKPLVVMVNRTSASSSELFAAAMQDQNRAVIVGGKTFGKSTMQNIIPLGENGFLKTTTGKFYRVTGKSHQKTGVVPDIELPSYYSKLNISESMYPSALENTSITHKTYYYPAKQLPIESLKALSKSRVDTNSYFKKIASVAEFLYQQTNHTSIPINYDQFELYYKQISLLYDGMVSDYENTSFTVHNPVYLSNIGERTETEKSVNQQNIENIKNDIFIAESFNVIKDLINN
jgi:carboxyl-terminal processing protease